ncbi:hypothetical protein PoB_000499800 [Plakobranchus ocellatus]|uniref:Uncharacterized protein n=1 Tax=Plakobranchus ocellatus TaxID=259542 RepID=A0AAV3Y7U1_9GAST|nr:hypothetical protein PoB_000499800 [Plakobranchus ocellatus]
MTGAVTAPTSSQPKKPWLLVVRRTDVALSSPQQSDLRLLSPSSGQDAGTGARTRYRRAPRRSQGGLAHHCATDTPIIAEEVWLEVF